MHCIASCIVVASCNVVVVASCNVVVASCNVVVVVVAVMKCSIFHRHMT